MQILNLLRALEIHAFTDGSIQIVKSHLNYVLESYKYEQNKTVVETARSIIKFLHGYTFFEYSRLNVEEFDKLLEGKSRLAI